MSRAWTYFALMEGFIQWPLGSLLRNKTSKGSLSPHGVSSHKPVNGQNFLLSFGIKACWVSAAHILRNETRRSPGIRTCIGRAMRRNAAFFELVELTADSLWLKEFLVRNDKSFEDVPSSILYRSTGPLRQRTMEYVDPPVVAWCCQAEPVGHPIPRHPVRMACCLI